MRNRFLPVLAAALLYLVPATRGQTGSDFSLLPDQPLSADEPLSMDQPLSVDQPLLLDAAPATAPSTTQPQSVIAGGPQTQTAADRTLAEFIGHFSGYDPMYFIAGTVSP